MKKKVYVLDTSALIGGFSPATTEIEQVTIEPVLNEVKDEILRSKIDTAVLMKRVKLLNPSLRAVSTIQRKIKRTGDSISETDVGLLALALDMKRRGKLPEIVTDDYGIQNVAGVLGIPCRAVLTPGIKKLFRWRVVCPACGRKYRRPAIRCEVCGSKLRRVPENLGS